jgi:hypothetical protein
MDFINAFLSNVSVNKPQQKKGKCVFSAVRVEEKHVARQHSGKLASTTMRDIVSHGVCAEELS